MKYPLHIMSYRLKRGENDEIPSPSIEAVLTYLLLKRGENYEIPSPANKCPLILK